MYRACLLSDRGTKSSYSSVASYTNPYLAITIRMTFNTEPGIAIFPAEDTQTWQLCHLAMLSHADWLILSRFLPKYT